MRPHRFRLLNVFPVGDDPFSGNPLCVFEDGSSLSAAEMQALAQQFNLSETTFLLPGPEVRIFTPAFEMPFAGHPTLGTAHVVRELARQSAVAPDPEGSPIVLRMKAGPVEVTARGDEWTLRAARAPVTREPRATRESLATMLGLAPAALDGPPMWVDTGSEQLVIPLATAEDVKRARPQAELLEKLGRSEERGEGMAYVWAPTSRGEVVARFFFRSHGGVVEDPATGSACANLGGWMLATGRPLPLALEVSQGSDIGRPSLLKLRVDEARRIYVGGTVRQLGRGEITLG
jgi:trans-2,3-dihydro-3-hydroxyanthranilate isomerase